MRWLPAILLLTHLNAAVVKQDRTALRTGCYPDSDPIITLDKGTALKIQSSRSGETEQCYKVLAEVNGKKVEGFLTASLIEDLEEFDKARRSAAWIDVKQIVSSIQEGSQSSKASAAAPSLTISSTGTVAKQAALLIDSNQPAKALALLETELKKNKDAGVYALAGVAAWKSDDTAKAVEYVRTSLEMRPSPDLQKFYEELQRQNKGDRSGERLLGMRVQLRYEGVTIAPEIARQMLTVLDEEFARISAELGCAAEERILAIAQSPSAYRQTTNAAEWSGGQFDGKIRIPVEKSVDRRVLAHETAHACLAMLGHWPSWLHEGIAQKISGDSLPPAMQKRLSDLAGKGQLPKLENLAQDWSRMNAENAQLAYSLALYAVEVFAREYSAIGLRSLLRTPDRLPAITAELDKRLGY